MPIESARPVIDRQWDAVPAERQAYYRRVYQRELQKANATLDDAAELSVLRQLIDAYKQQSLVPVGTGWAIVPDRSTVRLGQNYLQNAER